MRIAIVGYGKMGRIIRNLAVTQGHRVTVVIDPYVDAPEVTGRTLDGVSTAVADVAIDFSAAAGIEQRLDAYAAEHLPAVIGTTGWYDRLEEISGKFKDSDCAIMWSGNFSLGVHLFFAIVRQAALLCNSFPSYDPMVVEAHHMEKADSPSGTAAMIGTILLEALERKERVETGRLDRKRDANEIHIASLRGGYVPGTHTVMFDSPVDTIEITHRARNREGFAYGALRAAEWITNGKRGFFSLQDMLSDLMPATT